MVETIRCRAEEFLELVMDVERYAVVDDKIGPIEWVRRDRDVTEFRFRPRLPGLPGPAPRLISRMVLTPGERIDIAYADDDRNRIARRLSTFRASFSCRPVPGGTEVTRIVTIGFPPVLRLVLEPLLRRRWQASVERELRLAKPLLERPDGAPDA